MASAKVYYELIDTQEQYERNLGILCLTCAIKTIVRNIDSNYLAVRLVSDSYGYHRCKDCNAFIEDEIEI